jgi:LPXTG-site transpeptidase (sortase) family protein
MSESPAMVVPALPTPAVSRVRRPRPTGWRLVAHWSGLLSLMLAAGFAGYVAWLLWGTGLSTQRSQDVLRKDWTQVVDTKRPSQAPKLVPLGSRYAEIQIPSIGLDMMVVQGTEYPDLKLGPGHYVDTANPWDDTGRVGIAGHRTTYLHPFFKLDQIHQGDTITIRTEYGTFAYRVNRAPFVVPESGSGFVLTQTPNPTLVLTTCNPKYSSYERLIVTAVRVGATGTQGTGGSG